MVIWQPDLETQKNILEISLNYLKEREEVRRYDYSRITESMKKIKGGLFGIIPIGHSLRFSFSANRRMDGLIVQNRQNGVVHIIGNHFFNEIELYMQMLKKGELNWSCRSYIL